MGKIFMRPPILNERLKLLRKEAGYSYKKLEEITGISRSTLQRYESNPFADIPLNKLTTLANAYGVSVSYILGSEDRNMPYEYFKSLSPLLKEIGYEFQYDEYDKSYELLIKNHQHENSFYSIKISNEQIKNLKETTLSYLKFKINEIISSCKPPTAE